MRVLVTGADGFAGRYLLRHLLQAGHDVIGGVRPGSDAARGWLTDDEYQAVRWTPVELGDPASVGAATASLPDAVVHLAAVASGSEARRDPGQAWEVNAAGTARLVESLGRQRVDRGTDPSILVVSSAEVYGIGEGAAHRESDAVAPVSPYGASKAGAEIAALEAWRRFGLRVIIARAFQHTGPGQSGRYVVPALAGRLIEARRTGARRVPSGNLDPVRDIADVRDVVRAYAALLEHGVPGEAYNVSRGEGLSLLELFHKLSAIVGVQAVPELDPALARRADIPHLVGDHSKLRAATGWSPTVTVDQMLRDVVHAQAD